jgi:hypothetical protein
MRSEFYPFGAVITESGEVRLMMAAMRDDKPPSNDVLEKLYRSFRSQSPTIRAAATATDVKLPDGMDGVKVELEHKDGIAIAVILPYRMGETGLEYGDMRASTGDRHVWIAL